MLALTSLLSSFLAGLGYVVIGAFIVAVAGAVVRTFSKHKEDARDSQGLREFFFDTPANERTGVPAKEGWTTKVDKQLNDLDRATREILREVKPDHNGGHNLRGAVDRAAKKADEE